MLLLAAAACGQVVISQVYGGGQGAAAVYKNDYVELFNPTASPVSLAGWTVQYQPSGSTGAWSGKVALAGTIGANKYFLVQMSSATGSGASALDLPTPDVTSTAVSMSATAGKVALTTNTTTLTTAVGPPVVCPTGVAVADLFGYGANCAEGTSAPALTTTTAALRAGGGCTDTNSNSADFASGTPAPRNSSSPANSCTAGSTSPTATGSASPTPVVAGSSVTLSATVTPGTNPASTGTAVSCNLSRIGGSATFSLAGSGTSFSSAYTVPGGTAANGYVIPCSVSDNQSRSGTFNISVQVVTSTAPTAAGSASPNPVQAGNGTTLSATVTPGTNPASTGTAVSCNLGAIGGSTTFSLPSPGFSAGYTVPANTTSDTYPLPCTVSDAQSRSSNFTISLVVSSQSSSPTGTGSANPNGPQPGASTLLTVTVTPGSNPTSTNLAVATDLSSIGGSAAQPFFDDGSNGDVTAHDNIFSFNATVTSTTTPGGKTLPATISDGESRSGTANISLTVQFPPAPTTVKISQVYGGGGNSGSTYTNDFIEIFNQSTSPVDISLWSVQQTSAGASGTWSVTNLCPDNGSCILPPNKYYLVQEAQGTNGTTALPAADAFGVLTMGATSGKVALVNNTIALSGACPSSSNIGDLVGYGGAAATCSETAPFGSPSNTTAVVRKGNGCIDTNNNANDFVEIGPIPRNSHSPANSCGGNAGLPSGLGTATPASVDPAGTTLLTVAVTPATAPPSTGLSVVGDLTSIGGAAGQAFYDDGSNGDQTAGDNVFSLRATVGAFIPTGAKSIGTTITDAQSRTASAPITLTVQSPTCGVERWSVKVGTDPDAGLVNLNSPLRSTIASLRAIPAPGTIPLNSRVAPAETTVYVINGVMTAYKRETDVDYHIVVQDPAGNTMVTEIPSPACDGTTSPFDSAVAAIRAKFDARLTADTSFQTVSLPVQMKGVGFFDFIHGQTGVAPNGIELHPLLDMTFTTASTTTLASNLNPSQYGQSVTFTATLTSAAGTPTGSVSFSEGPTLLGTGTLDPTGHATFTTSALSLGSHSITASYDGDSQAAQSASAPLSQGVNQATPVLTWPPPAPITYGGALGSTQLNATTTVPGTFAYTPPAGTVLPVGNGQTLSVNFTPSSGNYTSASKSVTIDVLPASGGGSPANLVVTRTLARTGGQVVATLTIANNGGTGAQNVTLTAAKIGTVSGTPLPQSLGTIAAGGSLQTTVSFSGVGAPGAGSTLSVSGTYTGGTFSSSARITLP